MAGVIGPTAPRFFVVARVVGRDGSLPFWEKRLPPLCAVSATEPLGSSYYWGQDLDGEPNTTWGLEGYSHAVGFFIGHQSTDVFKREMALIDKDELLRHEQGLRSRDYDLYHYDGEAGWLTREDDRDKDSQNAHVGVLHIWMADEKARKKAMQLLGRFADKQKQVQGPDGALQSLAVLKEIKDVTMTTLWIRTKTRADFDAFRETHLQPLLAEIAPVKTELHNSRVFIGHLDKIPPSERDQEK